MVTDERGEYVNNLKAQDVTVFENEIEKKPVWIMEYLSGTDIQFLIDNSGSVRTQMKAVAAIAGHLVQNRMPDDTAQIIRFIGRDKIEISQPWTHNEGELIEAINNLYVEGGQTAVYDALYLGTEDLIARNKRTKSRKQVIILISDGDD